jgi:hypothetical protein
MSSATHIKLRAKMDSRAAEAALVEAQMAQAARVEEARLAQERTEQASDATLVPGTEQPRRDLVNPFETPGGVDETLTPECRVKPLVPVVLPPDIEGGELDVETQEDFDRLDNDILAQPAIPDFNTVLFSPETIEAFASPARHAQALGMVKELLQQKDEIAKLAYAQRVANNPHDIDRGLSFSVMYQALLAICLQVCGSPAST